MRNIMVDLETMSLQPNAAIVAIGAVAFDETGIGEKFYRVVALEESVNMGLHLDPGTVMWWMQQSGEARGALALDPRPLMDTLFGFGYWMQRIAGNDAAIWGNGATFDNVVLANAYKVCGIPRPWSYKNDRCYRTLKALLPSVAAPLPEGVLHNALNDAEYQALHAVQLLRALGSGDV